MIHKKYIYSFIILITQLLFLIVKDRLGAYTPDEVLYTTGEYHRGLLDMEEIPLKFYVTYKIISFFYSYNVFLFPVIQILLTTFVYLYLYKKNEVFKITNQYVLILFFLLPSALYFCSAYLRDYVIYLSSIVLLFYYKIYDINLKTIILFFLLLLFRYEAGIIVILSYLLVVKINNRFIKLDYSYIPYVLIFFILILALLINIDFIWDNLYNRFTNPNRDYYGLSIWQVTPSKSNVLVYCIFNWFAFYAPFIFKESFSLFSYFMLLDSIIVGYLFLRALFNISSTKFRNDALYQISYLIFLSTFFLSILEVVPETMYRHRMAYLPFLIYLNFTKK